MEKKKLELEKVFSPIEDKKIKDNLVGSPIWKNAKHLEDVTKEDKKKGGFVYTIYFDGVTPLNVTSVKKLKK